MVSGGQGELQDFRKLCSWIWRDPASFQQSSDLEIPIPFKQEEECGGFQMPGTCKEISLMLLKKVSNTFADCQLLTGLTNAKKSQVQFLQIAAVAPNNGTEPSTGPASTTAAPEAGCGNKQNTYHHFI